MLTVALMTLLTANQPVKPLTWRLGPDLGATAALVGGWVLSETVLKNTLAPAACRWCATNDFDLSVRKAFYPSLQPSPQGEKIADLSSGVVGFAVLPLMLVGLDAWLMAGAQDEWVSEWAVDILLATEATFAALALNQVVKFSVGRARPFTVDAPPGLLAQAVAPSDANLSFFSGHTTLAFGVVASLSTIASMRGHKAAPLMWVLGTPVALVTSLLRIGADKHWASDVLLGALVGTAFGIGVPLLFHAPVDQRVSLRLVPFGQGAMLTGTF